MCLSLRIYTYSLINEKVTWLILSCWDISPPSTLSGFMFVDISVASSRRHFGLHFYGHLRILDFSPAMAASFSIWLSFLPFFRLSCFTFHLPSFLPSRSVLKLLYLVYIFFYFNLTYIFLSFLLRQSFRCSFTSHDLWEACRWNNKQQPKDMEVFSPGK